ncbi:MAG: 3-isopropylmalate dehydratase small subunit [Dinoroseobacter sp.]|nr:3-isopropylmalate dehydratase small subunit [Dinoroseobacter sp.]
MTGWTTHTGRAVSLPIDGIDTDQIIPARFMSQPRSKGYGHFLLHDLRDDSDFPLNNPAAKGASILVSGRNFGSGSSREAAVYALVDAGFRAVIAPSFGDIFSSNAVNNGLAPVQLAEEEVNALHRALSNRAMSVSLDIQKGRLTLGEIEFGFHLDPVWTQKLVEGWDDIDLTRAWASKIAAFRSADRAGRDWAWPKRQAKDTAH